LFGEQDLSEKIGWLQLAEDDREILPRVVYDEEAEEFNFEMFHFVEKEVVLSMPIDMSMSKVAHEDIIPLISPCTSVYTMNHPKTRMKMFC